MGHVLRRVCVSRPPALGGSRCSGADMADFFAETADKTQRSKTEQPNAYPRMGSLCTSVPFTRQRLAKYQPSQQAAPA